MGINPGTINGTGWTLVTPGTSFAVATLNAAPTVDAGPDLAVTMPGAAALSGSATDDGVTVGPLTFAWTKTSGPGTVAFGTRQRGEHDRHVLGPWHLRADAHRQ